MASYSYDKFVSITIESYTAPMKGQKNRSSYNYDFTQLQSSTHIMWICPDGVSFNVMKDISFGTDDVLLKNVHNGLITPSIDSDAIYIANPRVDAAKNISNFEIEIIPVEYAPNTSWLREIEDDVKIRNIMLPGTHDSAAIAAYASKPWKCQNLSITDQLAIGVRILDIRLMPVEKDKSYYFYTCHGSVGLGVGMNVFQSFESVIEECEEFLKGHESEFIVMSLKFDDLNGVSETVACQELDRIIKRERICQFDDYTIKQVRGSIVIIDRYSVDEGMGRWKYQWKDNTSFTCDNLCKDTNVMADVQDVYSCFGNGKKMEYIKKLINKRQESLMSDSKVFTLNFCSGYLPCTASTYKLDTIETMINYLGEQIKEKDQIVNLGWFMFDFIEKEYMIEPYDVTVNVIECIIDANRKNHCYYKYKTQASVKDDL